MWNNPVGLTDPDGTRAESPEKKDKEGYWSTFFKKWFPLFWHGEGREVDESDKFILDQVTARIEQLDQISRKEEADTFVREQASRIKDSAENFRYRYMTALSVADEGEGIAFLHASSAVPVLGASAFTIDNGIGVPLVLDETTRIMSVSRKNEVLAYENRFLTRMYARFGAMAGPPCSDRGCGCNSLLSGSHRLYE